MAPLSFNSLPMFGGGPGKSFNVREGPHKVLTYLVFAGCIIAWILQLSGTAAQQACCNRELQDLLVRNNIHPVMDFLDVMNGLSHTIDGIQAQAKLDVAKIMANPNLTAAQKAAQASLASAQAQSKVTTLFTNNLQGFVVNATSSIATLAVRSTAVFTFTPDTKCGEYYRYQWLTLSIEFVVLVLSITCVCMDYVHYARVCLCCFNAVSTCMAIQCAHSSYYVYHAQYAPHDTEIRGKVTFCGMTGVAIANLTLFMLLGIHDELADMAPAQDMSGAKV